MKFNMNNNNKKSKLTGIVIAILSFMIIAGGGAWLGYNGWDFGKSVSAIIPAEKMDQERGSDELIPTGGDPTETEEVPSDKKPEVPVEEKNEEPVQEPSESIKEEDKGQPNGSPQPAPTKEKVTPPKETPAQPAAPKVDSGGYVEGMELPKEPTYINGILVANKKHPLPQNFAPGENKEAREAFEKMAAEAKLAGFELVAFSTYRSFEYQTTLYQRYVERDGQAAADRYSARPGYSEHQTGLAFDIGEKNFEQYWASSKFGETPAGKWVAENAHRYGFILRYPEGKEDITGYMHESWHFRYVGEGIARDIYINNLTLEEYLKIN